MVKPPRWQLGLVLGLGVAGISASAIWIRWALAAATGEVWALSAFLAAARLQVATVLLLPLSLPLPALAARGWRYAVAAGLALALHFVSWIASLALTSIAASTALVTTHPLWVALAAQLVWGQRARC